MSFIRKQPDWQDWALVSGTTFDHDALLRIFCLPHAGGGASRYRRWRATLGYPIEVCPVLLPGREGREVNAPLSSLKELTVRLCDYLMPWLTVPFAFAGLSMGALVA